MPPGPDGQPLPALPGAGRESRSITAILGKANVTLLGGLEASEPAVRDQLPAHRVVHFATHGVLIDDRPFDSFLALGGRTGDGPADGRLTVREVYDLRLRADLVVLSACRTAAGPVTGDGIVGLTRAFFYAGANSLLATLWDVADEPTRLLIAAFYRHYSRGRSKSEALRAAQLELLAALRQGRVAVATPLGRMSLNEHPVFWAGFIILGRP
jgi:CHAT domain-containing protein